ncbi:MAG: peptidase MA family metallohydrolase [Clostridia bacterium]|nr:peptidase MA family metallohydrolase [Clostridia bacterium]
MRFKRKTTFLIFVFVFLSLIFISNFKDCFFVKSYPIFRQIQNISTAGNYDTYSTKKSENFIVKYKRNDSMYVDSMLQIAEQSYDQVSSFLSYSPERGTELIIYQDSYRLNRDIGVLSYKKTMGAYSKGRILILSPREWAGEDINSEDAFKVIDESGVVLHEFTHLVVDEITNGNYPLWFTEGIALYAEYQLLKNEWHPEIEEQDIYYTIDDLTDRFIALDDDKAYRKSFLIVKRIVDQYGQQKLMDILNRLGQGMRFEDCIREITGTKLEEIADVL